MGIKNPNDFHKPAKTCEERVEPIPAYKLSLMDDVCGGIPVSGGEVTPESATALGFGVFRLKALQPLHIRPSSTLNKIRNHFKEKDSQNEVFIPLSKDDAGNAIGDGGWQALEPMNTLTKLEILNGKRIDFKVVGPDAADMESLIRICFKDNFHRKARKRRPDEPDGYLECYEKHVSGVSDVWFDGMLSSLSSASHESNPQTFSDMKPGASILENPNIVGELILSGPGARSGWAAAGIGRHVNLQDFSRNYALGSQKMVGFEVERLLNLEKLLNAGGTYDAAGRSVGGIPLGESERVGWSLWMDIQVDEAKWLGGVISTAKGIASRETDAETLKDRGIKADVFHGAYPNAELALELAIDTQAYSEDNRDKYQGIKRTAMQYLSYGLDSSKMMGRIMGQMTASGSSPFKRCGIYLLQEGPEGEYLESSLEWKDGSVRDMTGVDKRQLIETGVGVVETFRRGIDGNSDAIIIGDAATDPLTKNGYIEARNAAFKVIPGQLGVIWADNRDETPILPEDTVHLDQIADSMSYILSMNRKINEYRLRAGEHEIAILNRDPTGSEVIHLMDRGYLGYAAPSGKENCHGVIISGGNRMPCAVGLGDDLREKVPDGSLVLIADTSDSEDAIFILKPRTSALAFFGLAPGMKKSIEPKITEITDAVTTDGFRVHLRGALMGTRRDQLERFIDYGSEGIGFMRLEMVMINDPPDFNLSQPGAERLLENYVSDNATRVGQVLYNHSKKYNAEPVIGRLTDVTDDKLPHIIAEAFGSDAARSSSGLSFLCRHWDKLMVPQVRGYCRANASFSQPFGIMLPNVQSVNEATKTIDFIRKTNKEINGDKPLQIYAQIESHHAVHSVMDSIAPYVDGFALGFNDLTESVTGIKRSAGGYPEYSQQVWEDVKHAQKIAKKHDKPLTSCGGLGERPAGVAALVGLGINSISMPPRFIPEIREDIKMLSKSECEQWVDEIGAGLPPAEKNPEEAAYKFLRRRIKKKMEDALHTK